MSKMIEVPDELYAELTEAAAEDRTTPLGWIAARLRLLRRSRHVNARPNGQTLAERAAELGLVGAVDSGGAERLSERHSEVFGEMIEAQQKAGRP
ncbi:MAG TPA: hypothetical protein VLK84_00790 [Longimicrobium sp.]|nr:hypothetical protein [Longimicrobium sp.]